MRKVFTLILGAVLLSNVLSGQASKFEGGIFLGGANFQGDLVGPDLFMLEQTTFAYGLNFRYHLSHAFALRANLLHGKLKGDDSNFDRLKERGFSFQTPLTEFSVQFEWDILGKRSSISPYFFGGLGFTFFKPKTHYGDLEAKPLNLKKIDQDRKGDYATTLPTIPMGLGIKIDLSEKWVLGLELGMRTAFSDYLDGVSQAGNPDKNDWYSFYGTTITHRFGMKDTDKDKVADKYDACPEVFGVPSLKGCPDTDGDMVADKDDACPEVFGLIKLKGCPDSDNDGVVDQFDSCPNLAGIPSLQGCPDLDKDGIADHEDLCPTLAGLPDRGGCPFADSDDDGIEDELDNCPQLAGVAANNGCPLDTDQDGIYDDSDACPTEAGLASTNGCPDIDNDGIVDSKDQCPQEFGLAKYDGCPKAFSDELEVIDLNIRAVWFETAKVNINKAGTSRLDETAILMLRNPKLNLRINGYADSRGNDIVNQQLSEMRAKRCFEYFVSLGVKASRMVHQGYGESNPIGNNATPEGRRLNRRVEIELLNQQK
ncbi:MAG: hypothetical protein DHS20C18_55980 [Saprospiraceae bacterium]|nr:MAG: hypothetical protein DHS20C18_55980 [Saprospiraceae bacterium]